MYRTLLLLLLLLHMLGDFYFQPHRMAENKKTEYGALLRHCLLYGATLMAGVALLWSWEIFLVAGALAVLHWAVDSIKQYYVKEHPAVLEALVFCCDQLLHLGFILVAVVMLKSFAVRVTPVSFAGAIIAYLSTDLLTVLKWLCLIAWIGKPANVTIKLLISQHKPQDERPVAASQASISEYCGNPDSITIKLKLSQTGLDRVPVDPAKANVGAFIGTLERILIVLLLSLQEYAAIGLVLTAKSIARYEKLKEQDFAEYYLLGTLLSTLLAIAAYLFFFQWIL